MTAVAERPVQLQASRLTFVGAGPKTLGVLIWIAARAQAGQIDHPLTIDLIDPFVAGGGRVWRKNQHELLWMNSKAEDITVYPDADQWVDGVPPLLGPSLAEWIADHRPETGVSTQDFAPRWLCSEYLQWVLTDTLARLPEHVQVNQLRGRATHVAKTAAGYRVSWEPAIDFAAGEAAAQQIIDTDVAVLSVGYLEVENAPGVAATAQQAAEDGLVYVPPGYTADLDLSIVPAGEDVVVRGMGLAFIDAFMLLTEGRGGQFYRDSAGVMQYQPSGSEPRLWVGSRRGVPLLPKLSYQVPGLGFEAPRYLTDARLKDLGSPAGYVSVAEVLVPLLEAETMARHYRELVRVAGAEKGIAGEQGTARLAPVVGADDFQRRIDDWADAILNGDPARAHTLRAELDQFVAQAVAQPADRLSFAALDRPFAGRIFNDHAVLEQAIAQHTQDTLDRAADPAHSPAAAAFFGLVGGYLYIRDLISQGLVDPAERVSQVQGWLHGFFSYIASGPPPERLENVLAAHRAGIVRFAGPEMQVDVAAGQFEATNPNVRTHSAGAHPEPEDEKPAGGRPLVRASALVDAFLAPVSAPRASDPMLQELLAAGLLSTEDIDAHLADGAQFRATETGRAVRTDGETEQGLFLLGPSVVGAVEQAFARPGIGSQMFINSGKLASWMGAELKRRTQILEVHSG